MLKVKSKDIDISNLCYIAGFLDGDGCILSQIVRRKDYKTLSLACSLHTILNSTFGK